MPADLAFLATLAKAAYHLRPDEHLTVGGDTANKADTDADAIFAGLSASLTLFGAADLSIGGLPATSPFADVVGLQGGLFVNGNAAALVGRAGDTLFIAVRGTNDGGSLNIFEIGAGGGSFDQDHWFASPFAQPDEGMAAHYALLKPLFDAAMAFMNNPANGIAAINVSGHSLGGAMVQKFMADHAGDARLRAATFGEPGYENFAAENSDSRIFNFAIAGDPVAELPQALGDNFGENGDDFRIVSKNAIPDPHSMDHYLALAGFFAGNDFDALFFDGLAANGARDEMNVIVDASIIGDDLSVRLPGGNIEGSDAGDILLADATASYIDGRGGADHLFAGAGDDAVVGGAGADRIAGGEGRDFAFGGAFTGERAFATNSGDDAIAGDAGDDGLWGFDGADTLDGGEGNDSLVGGTGNDVLTGGAGNDFLFGGDFTAGGGFATDSGNDALNGGEGGDALWGFDGNDTLSGGAGADYAEGGAGDDTVNGGADSDTLLGQDGADMINGGAGFDYLYGGAGADTFIFRKGDSADWILDFGAIEGDRLRLLDFGYATFAAIPLVDLSTPGNPAVQFSALNTINGSFDQLTIFGVTLAQLNATNVLVS